jgi:hypothetical protein
MKQWIEDRCRDFLLARGYWVFKSHVPQLIVSYGSGTIERLDGETRYVINMPEGHKLSVLNNTMLTALPR